MPDDQVPRRRLLTALLGTAVLWPAACSAPRDAPPKGSTGTSRTNPDLAIRERAAHAERTLIAAYAATITRHPALSERLTPISTNHAAHLQAFTDGSPSGSPLTTEANAATATPLPAIAPEDPTAALAALVSVERATAARTLDDLPDASPPLARLLASVGAAEAAHAALLGS